MSEHKIYAWMKYMFEVDVSMVSDSLLILLLAVLFDVVFGELPDRVHPTVWMGKTTEHLKHALHTDNPKAGKLKGVLLCLLLIVLFTAPVALLLWLVRLHLGWLPYILASAFILQSTFAIKCMRQYTLPVYEAVKVGDIDEAKQLLPFIVRRSPDKLTEAHIISAAVETIAEGTTDGVTSPFFYFALFGVPGAVAFRTINTLDSMVGYKDPAHIDVGWFSARMDTAANYIPARLTAALMILSALLLRKNWRKSIRILKRDRGNTESPNAGWTISAMAGALDVQVEKPGFYQLGDNNKLTPSHIKEALQIMFLTTALFAITAIIPLLILVSLITNQLLTVNL